MWTRSADLISVRDQSALQGIAAIALFRLATSHVKREQFDETIKVTRRAWEYDCTDVPGSFRLQIVLPLVVAAIGLLPVDLDLEETEQARADLAEAERYARRAWGYSSNPVVSHVLSDILARQGSWGRISNALGEGGELAWNASQFGRCSIIIHPRLGRWPRSPGQGNHGERCSCGVNGTTVACGLRRVG